MTLRLVSTLAPFDFLKFDLFSVTSIALNRCHFVKHSIDIIVLSCEASCY
jgi:hypothetical protein